MYNILRNPNEFVAVKIQREFHFFRLYFNLAHSPVEMNCDVTKNVSTHRGEFVAKI